MCFGLLGGTADGGTPDMVAIDVDDVGCETMEGVEGFKRV